MTCDHVLCTHHNFFMQVQYMQHDVTRLQGQVQVLEGEKAERQTQFKILQAEGVILKCQVSDLTGQKAGLDDRIKVVEVRATGLEVQVTDLTSEVNRFKERARVAREEQSQERKVSNSVSCFAEHLTS